MRLGPMSIGLRSVVRHGLGTWAPAVLTASLLLSACDVSPSETEADDVSGTSRSVDSDDAAPVPAREAVQDFDAAFEHAYREAWSETPPTALAGTRLQHSTAVRAEVVRSFLRDYRPLERATADDLRAMLESGGAFRDTDAAMSALGLDARDLVDVLALHHAVHWAVVNRDRVRPEQLPAIRKAVASSSLMAGLSTAGDGARQEAADRAAILTAIRSREYGTLLQAGQADALRRYGDQVAAEFLSRHGIDLRDGDIARLPPLDTRGAPHSP